MIHLRRKLGQTKRRLVLWQRRRTPRLFANKPVCHTKSCPWYLSDKWMQRIQEDEFGRKVEAQWVCDYFAEGKPPGCGEGQLWLKEELKKYPDGRRGDKSRKVLPVGPDPAYIKELQRKRALE